MTDEAPGALSRSHYAALAAFRYELRRFLAFSEAAATAAGLPPQQHQALLTVAGHSGPELPTVGLIAERLLIAPHSAAELVTRMVEAGLLTKTRGTQDRRRMELALTPEAEALLHRLTAAHLEELRSLEPALARALALGREASPETTGPAPSASA
ncbi:MarR family winged helix-turn-helix transcriptional regulator [Methylorubrum zatmanii]|uniref:MarR family winged helix-turn-helix transcriptional regulator n=1 Tax=Methylorubrum zatmanii TaxID=29429 RepID=A0ABW1WWX3_9HYPH|nr:MarR family winged helix-turn-helix transcriptional regulator [Methylorubrum zatmanii]MBD8907283.1 MarR family transcriptional regulator [Methylorubrum zatmanii]